MTFARKYLPIVLLVLAGTAIAGGLLWRHVLAGSKSSVDGILTGTPCAPPCWQGIVPGSVVDRRTVVRQVSRMPGVSEVWENGPSVMWRWRRRPGYNVIFIDTDGVVQNISLSLDFELTVEAVIRQYGLPAATNTGPAPLPEEAYAQMNLFYPQHGLICRVRMYPDYRPVLEPQSVVHEVSYSVPADSLEAWLGATGQMDLQTWPGYGEVEGFRP